MKSRQEVFRNLYHYTPLLKTIKSILNTRTDIGDEEPKMNFLFGTPLSVNDKNEGCLYIKYLFSRCERNNEYISSCWQKLNHTFILCFIRHKSYKKYHVNSIPMWKMYGGDFKGFRMTLDYEKLNAFCQPNGCQLVKIQYVTKDELRKIAQEKYNEIKYRLSSCLNDEIIIKEITLEALRYKTKSWEYENEYRIVVFDDSSKVVTHNGKYMYPVYIPLSCLKDIMIGPNAVNKESKKKTLEKIKSKIANPDSFTVRESHILINQ